MKWFLSPGKATPTSLKGESWRRRGQKRGDAVGGREEGVLAASRGGRQQGARAFIKAQDFRALELGT